MRKIHIVIIVLCIQLFIPGWMIAMQELTLKKGDVYKFKTAPVDPYDPFRGRYVALNVEQQRRTVSTGDVKYYRGETVYAMISIDNEGFAVIDSVSKEKPKTDTYIKTTVKRSNYSSVRVNLPFDKYFMNEKKAPDAEKLYRENSRQGKLDAYIIVRVLKGRAVIEDLIIAGKPIIELLDKNGI